MLRLMKQVTLPSYGDCFSVNSLPMASGLIKLSKQGKSTNQINKVQKQIVFLISQHLRFCLKMYLSFLKTKQYLTGLKFFCKKCSQEREKIEVLDPWICSKASCIHLSHRSSQGLSLSFYFTALFSAKHFCSNTLSRAWRIMITILLIC